MRLPSDVTPGMAKLSAGPPCPLAAYRSGLDAWRRLSCPCTEQHDHLGSYARLSVFRRSPEDVLLDPTKGSSIPPDSAVKLHVGSRIPLDPIVKSISGSMIPRDLATKMANGLELWISRKKAWPGLWSPIGPHYLDEVTRVFWSLKHAQYLTRLIDDFPKIDFIVLCVINVPDFVKTSHLQEFAWNC